MANYLSPSTYGYTPQYGGVPNVPDPTQMGKRAAKGTLSNLPDISKLGEGVNQFQVGQYTSRLPGYVDMAKQSSSNIGAALRGEVPEDVINLIGQQAAERGVARGVPGSQLSNADYLKALGLTSLGLKQYGETALTGATNRLNAVPQFNAMTYGTTPEDEYNAQLQQNIYGAAPLPSAAAEMGKRDLRAGSATTPGQSYTNLTGSGGGGRSARDTNPYLNPTPNFAPVMATGSDWGKPAPVSTYNPWSLNPSGQFNWNLPTQNVEVPSYDWTGNVEVPSYDWTGSDYIPTYSPQQGPYAPPNAGIPEGRSFNLEDWYGDETNWDDTLWFGE